MKLVRALGVGLGLLAVYFGVLITGDVALDGLQDSGLAIGVALAYFTAGSILLIPWRIARSPSASLVLLVLLLVSSIAGLAYGFGPALGWAFIHGAVTGPALLIVLLALAVLFGNIALAFRLVIASFRGAGRPVPD